MLYLQLVHPHFAPLIRYWILHTSKVKADEIRNSQGVDRSGASRFLHIARTADSCRFVRSLDFTLQGSISPRKGISDTRTIKMNQCMQVLNTVSPYVRELRLQGSTSGCGPDEWQTTASDITFPNLRSLEVSSYYFPLLLTILCNSPQIKQVTIGEPLEWGPETKTYSASSTYATRSDGSLPPSPRVELLRVNPAGDFWVLLYLANAEFKQAIFS